MIQRNSNQGFRYMPNPRNGFDPALGPQGLMNPMLPLQLDSSGMPVSPMEAPRTGPVPITTLASALASANSQQQQRQMLGEHLFPLVERLEHEYAGKVTGMLLEMDQTEVLHLIDSPDALKKKVAEAMDVLQLATSGTDTASEQLGSLSLND